MPAMKDKIILTCMQKIQTIFNADNYSSHLFHINNNFNVDNHVVVYLPKSVYI